MTHQGDICAYPCDHWKQITAQSFIKTGGAVTRGRNTSWRSESRRRPPGLPSCKVGIAISERSDLTENLNFTQSRTRRGQSDLGHRLSQVFTKKTLMFMILYRCVHDYRDRCVSRSVMGVATFVSMNMGTSMLSLLSGNVRMLQNMLQWGMQPLHGQKHCERRKRRQSSRL